MEDYSQLTPTEQRQRSKEIDAQLRKDQQESLVGKHRKVVILGPGDSGKTTILRQMVLMNQSQFTSEERTSFRESIRERLLMNVRLLLDAILMMEYPKELQPFLVKIQREIEEPEKISQLQASLTLVMENETIKRNYLSMARTTGMDDTFPYFSSKLGQVFDDSYVPSEDDILHTRRPTDQITETILKQRAATFHFFDVPGQKDKRFRWAQYFEVDLNALMYIASSASFDQVLEEDATVNRFIDGVVLFDNVINHPLLLKTNTILMLNKIDLLKEKLERIKFKDYVVNYEGPNQFDKVIRFINKLFVKCNKTADRGMVTHVTTAVDRKLMTKICSSVQYFD
ncbi:guanine nucleotide binding protein, alpha subunit [Gorgonomyces haynaldii]|nr:guanine nucleotide binding protein, alpha subunit [Gorgonomyces haynaldii]